MQCKQAGILLWYSTLLLNALVLNAGTQYSMLEPDSCTSKMQGSGN